MQRVQVRLSDDLASYLARQAAAKGTTLAGAILEAVEAQHAADEKRRRVAIALAALKKPAFRSVLQDPSESHQESIARATEERIGRR